MKGVTERIKSFVDWKPVFAELASRVVSTVHDLTRDRGRNQIVAVQRTVENGAGQTDAKASALPSAAEQGSIIPARPS